MSHAFYSARSLNVELYTRRTERRDHPVLAGDIDFYLQHAHEAGGPVLELACGNGRIVLPMARAGFETTGMDLSEPMLEVARQRLAAEPIEVQSRLRLVRGNMRDFELGQQFGTVIIAFRSFQLLTSPADERSCLQAVRRHMQPGATLLMDIFDPLLDRLTPGEQDEGARSMDTTVDPETGHRYEVGVISRHNDTVEQLLREVWRFTERDETGHVLRQEEEVLTMRWIYRWEMRYLLELCGFEVVHEYSDYFGAPAAYGKEQIYVARAV